MTREAIFEELTEIFRDIFDDEEIELTHLASNRRIFAAGAVKASANLVTRPAGFYSIDDILFS